MNKSLSTPWETCLLIPALVVKYFDTQRIIRMSSSLVGSCFCNETVPLSYFVFHFVFIFITLRGGLKKISLIYVTECSAYVFLQEFIVSGLTFRSSIHFEFTFVHGVRKCSNFILLHVVVQFSKHHLLKRLSFLHYLINISD